MKIGIISNLYPPFVRGGAEHVVVRTVEGLLELDQDIFVISGKPKRGGKGVVIDEQPMERIYRFYPWNIYFLLEDNLHIWPVRLIWHILDAFIFSPGIRVGRILDKELPDVVITHNLKGLGLRIPGAIHRRKIPHVHVVHDLQLIYPSGLLYVGQEIVPKFYQFCYSIYQWICKGRFGSPDIVIFPSQFLKNEYFKLGFFKDSKVLVMPNPAPRITPIVRGERTPGPLRLFFVGQLEEHKGIRFLLDVFKKIDFDARLIIAGEGTLVDLIKERAQQDERITYLGYVALDQLVNCFGLADALVVPSLCYENSPSVIYESFEAGVPVLASKIGGVGELVVDGENGYLFTAGDASDLLRVIKELDKNKIQFNKEQREITSTVAPYSVSAYARRLLMVLRGLVGKKEQDIKIADPEDYLGKMVKIIIDQPIGSIHPIYNYFFKVNYGYVPDTLAADDYEVDAYLLGIDKPMTKFEGRCIACVLDEVEKDEKLVIVPEGTELTDQEIIQAVQFNELNSEIKVVRPKGEGRY